jgi:phosphoglycolate phosphatase
MSVAAAVLFDLDGTLTDSAPGILRSTRDAIGRLSAEDGVARAIPSEAELAGIVGPPLRQSFAKLVGADKADRLLALYRERYEPIGMFENALYDGVVEALERLAALGYRLIVATSKVETYAKQIVAHFGLDRYFAAVYGSQPDGSRADKDQILAFLIAREGLAAAPRKVMIGDRSFDALGARAVGIPAIGALWGYGDAAELSQAGADPLIASPRDIPAAVATVFARGG